MSKLHTLSPLDNNFISYLQEKICPSSTFTCFTQKKKSTNFLIFSYQISKLPIFVHIFSSFISTLNPIPTITLSRSLVLCLSLRSSESPSMLENSMSKQWRSSTYHLQNLCTQWLSNYQSRSLFLFSAKFLPLSQHHQKSCLHWLAPVHSSTCSNLAGTHPAPVGRFLNVTMIPLSPSATDTSISF